MGTNDEITLMFIDMEEMDVMDKHTLQMAIDKKATEGFGTLNKVANIRTPVSPTQAKGKTAIKPPKNDMVYQYEPYQQEYHKPSHIDVAAWLLNNSYTVCIDDGLYIFEYSTGHYKPLYLDGGTFTKFVFRDCPGWFKREIHMNMMSKIYYDLIGLIQKHQRHRCFTNEDIEFVKNHFILTNDCIYEIDTGTIHQGFNPEIAFIQKGLNVWLMPFIQQKLSYTKHFDAFLEEISNGSEQVKTLFKGFLGCLFANSEYNSKKIVILYGHTATIKTIIKLLEYCLNKGNISRIPLDELSNRYALHKMEFKCVNISPYTDGQTLIEKLGEIIQALSGEYIYTKNKGDDFSTLNDKSFVLCTDETLDLNALIAAATSLDSVLLIPISKAVEKINDIKDKINQLKTVTGYMFLESMKVRKSLEDNDWFFAPLPAFVETLASIEEVQAEKQSDELHSFMKCLDKYCIFDKHKKIRKGDLVSCSKDYCEQNNRTAFENKTIVEGIRIKVCEVLEITPEEFNAVYKNGDGKNMMIDGKQGRGFGGIGLKNLTK